MGWVWRLLRVRWKVDLIGNSDVWINKAKMTRCGNVLDCCCFLILLFDDRRPFGEAKPYLAYFLFPPSRMRKTQIFAVEDIRNGVNRVVSASFRGLDSRYASWFPHLMRHSQLHINDKGAQAFPRSFSLSLCAVILFTLWGRGNSFDFGPMVKRRSAFWWTEKFKQSNSSPLQESPFALEIC